MSSVDPKVRALTKEELSGEVRRFRKLLDEQVEERVIHDFLASHSYFFNGILRLYGRSPLYSKVKLGNDHEVDFAWFDTGSYGAEWRLVEIESPKRPMFTKAGEPSGWLNHALQQVRDWNAWVHENVDYARKLMPHVEYPLCYVFVGRRSDLTPEATKRLKRLRYELRMSTEIRTLDWIADSATSVASLIGEDGGDWDVPARAYSQADLRAREPASAFEWLDLPQQQRWLRDGLRYRLEEREASIDPPE